MVLSFSLVLQPFLSVALFAQSLVCCKMPSAPRLDIRQCELRYGLQDSPAWVFNMTKSRHWERDTKPSPVIIKHGHAVWNQFLAAIKLQDYQMTCLFDKHGVIDTVDCWDEAARIGVALDHEDDVCSLMCSYGRSCRQEITDRDKSWHPLSVELEGHIFTDKALRNTRAVNVYREHWMPEKCVAISGDKKQVGQLLGKPSVLFDDRLDILNDFRSASHPAQPMGGVFCDRRSSAHFAASSGVPFLPFPRSWLDIVHDFPREILTRQYYWHAASLSMWYPRRSL